MSNFFLPRHELRAFVRPEFHVSTIKNMRTMRFDWSVANVGNADFLGPNLDTNKEDFTTVFGRLSVSKLWSITLLNEATGLSTDYVGDAFVSWDYKTLTAGVPQYRDWFRNRQTGISPMSDVYAPGFLTMLPLEVDDGDYLALFSFDPEDKWGGLVYAENFRIRVDKMSVLPI